MPYTYLKLSELIAKLTETMNRFGDTVVLYDRIVWGSLALHAKSQADGEHVCDLREPAREVYMARAVEFIVEEVAEKGEALVECTFLYDHFAKGTSENVAMAAQEVAAVAGMWWSFIDDRTRVRYHKNLVGGDPPPPPILPEAVVTPQSGHDLEGGN